MPFLLGLTASQVSPCAVSCRCLFPSDHSFPFHGLFLEEAHSPRAWQELPGGDGDDKVKEQLPEGTGRPEVLSAKEAAHSQLALSTCAAGSEGDFAGNLPLILASCFLPWGTAQKV